jgi:hypothetical protein
MVVRSRCEGTEGVTGISAMVGKKNAMLIETTIMRAVAVWRSGPEVRTKGLTPTLCSDTVVTADRGQTPEQVEEVVHWGMSYCRASHELIMLSHFVSVS